MRTIPLEQINYSQVVTFAPQAQPWSQAVITGGTSTAGQVQFGPFGGLSYFTSGAVSEAGDRFQLWRNGVLKEPTVFTVAGTLPNTAVTTRNSPGRFTTIVSVNLTPGTYLINWTVQLAGTVRRADVNNFVLYNGASTQVAQSVNLGAPGIYPQAPQVVTVLAGSPFVQVLVYGNPATSGSIYSAGIGNWFTFFNPAPQAVPVNGDIAIALPTPKNPRWLGAIGHVSGLVRSYVTPGGPDSLTLLLRLPADYRTDAINPGRVVQVWRGASCVWEGKLDEPAPGANGWTVSAHGAGQYGTDFSATYNAWNADDAVNQAIGRGLRWSNPGIAVDGLAGTYNHALWAFDGTDQLYTHTTGATWTGTFTGSEFQWWATTNSNHGIATISIDGGAPVNVDGYSASLVYSAMIFDSGVLSPGTHTVVITCTGTKNVASSGIYVAVNYLVQSGIWLAQQQDSGSETITAHLNLLISGGGLLWQVTRGNTSTLPAGPWVLQVKPFVSDFNGNMLVNPDRILICSTPVTRTVHADINTLIIRYQATADIPATGTAAAVPATFSTVTVSNQSSVSRHGPMEYYLDVSSGGVLTPAAVQTIGTNILSRFVRASFAGPFTAGPGQVRNTAGTPVDLGCDESGLVYQVMVTDAPYGGEVAAAPLMFLSGAYSYDEDTGTATITPYQSVDEDIVGLIRALYPSKF